MAFMCCSVTTDNVLSEFSMFGRKKKKRSFTDLKVFKLVLGEYRLETTLLAKPGSDLSTKN